MKLPYEPVLMAGPKPLLYEFAIHHRIERCAVHTVHLYASFVYLEGSEYNSLVFDVVDDESLAWLNESRADVFNVGHSDDKTIFAGTGALNLTEKLLLNRVHQLKNEVETVQVKISQVVLQVI